MELKEERGDPNSTELLGAVTVRDFLFTVTEVVTVALSHFPESVGLKSKRNVVVPAPTIVALSPDIVMTDVFVDVYENAPGTEAVTDSNLNVGLP
jgi:hypothetical protein